MQDPTFTAAGTNFKAKVSFDKFTKNVVYFVKMYFTATSSTARLLIPLALAHTSSEVLFLSITCGYSLSFLFKV